MNRAAWVDTITCLARQLNPLRDRDEFFFFHLDPWLPLSSLHFVRWLAAFTRATLLTQPSEQLRQQQLELSDFSVSRLEALMAADNNRLGRLARHSKSGQLVLEFAPAGGPGDAAAEVEESTYANQDTLEPVRRLDREQVLRLEPWLREFDQRHRLAGANFYPQAGRALAANFTRALAEDLVAAGDGSVTIHHGIRVLALDLSLQGQDSRPALPPMLPTNAPAPAPSPHSSSSPHSSGSSPYLSNTQTHRVSSIVTDQGRLDLSADTLVVVANGARAPLLLDTAGLFVPIYPLKGYCLEIEATDADRQAGLLPGRICVDDYVYVSPMGNQLRLASVGQFCGFDRLQPDPHIEAQLRAKAKRLLPSALADKVDAARCVTGLRPNPADGRALVGPCHPGIANLFITCGPGFEGWKAACGNAELLAWLLAKSTGQQPDSAASEEHEAKMARMAAVVSPAKRISLANPILGLKVRATSP